MSRQNWVAPDPSAPLDGPPQIPVIEQVANWTARQPHAIAVADAERAWTYEELQNASHRAAAALRREGLHEKCVVAVSGRAGFGQTASFLGVWHAGAVLLPVDTDLPPERKRRMLQQAEASCAILHGPVQDAPGWLDGIRIVDASAESPDPVRRANLAEDAPAYIFFTSGSTGRPKGVLGCHKGLSHFLGWQREEFRVGPGDRVAQLTNLSFDVMLRDFFLPLISGATVCIPSLRDRTMVMEWLRAQDITILHAVPSLAEAWAADLAVAFTLPALRWIFFSGEPLSDTLVSRWRNIAPCAGIVNLYGPTETTMAKCFHVVPEPAPPGVQAVGRPMPYCQALVVAEGHRLCGVGEEGEIVIRTPFRTLGYLLPDSAPPRGFRPNPFRDDSTDILYWTGDRGRYRPDGELQFLGRVDDQVKIRGVRVEPAEVAAVLQRHPQVLSCFVSASGSGGDALLRAYVVSRPETHLNARELRGFAAASLPDAMLPSFFIFIGSLPLLPNGKIDRRALESLPTEPESAPTEIAGPRNEVEERIVEVWKRVLRESHIGIHDNFFLIGGNSLKAMQMLAQLRRTMRHNISVRLVFECPTIAQLSEALIGSEPNEQAEF
jgi:amino acid adenylation domain-containing protein